MSGILQSLWVHKTGKIEDQAASALPKPQGWQPVGLQEQSAAPPLSAEVWGAAEQAFCRLPNKLCLHFPSCTLALSPKSSGLTGRMCGVIQLLETASSACDPLCLEPATPASWGPVVARVCSFLLSKCVNSSFSLWFLLKEQINQSSFTGVVG